MYKVKVDEKLLCFTGSVNGMEYVTDPDVKLVVNGVDSFSFAIYPQHPLYKEIECKVSRVKIWRDSELLFYGEVTGYSQDMYGIRTYDCEGALAWLNDLHFAYAISGATPKEVLYWYIKLYNQKLRDKSKSFELGTVTVHKALTQSGTEGTIARSSGVYPSFWEEIQDKLLDSFGGILRVRYVGSDTCAGYIDWLAIPDGTCSQDVRYAKNLLNCDWTYDCTALATAVVPLGKRKDSSGDNEVRLTIDKADDDDATFMIQYMTGTDDLVKSGNMVYSKSRMEKYGLIQQAVTFDDITDAGTLAYQGAVWLRQNGKAASTIRAEAIDLADIDESVEHFTHGDYVRTKLPGDSAESLFPITAIEIPIAAPENAKLTVGTQESGITSGSGGQGGGSIADAGSGADAMAHTHSNKGVLDKITEQDYADFKGAVNKAHVHANKDTLDKIDETSWLLVYGQTHEHENQSVLDKTTASYTAAEKTKLAGIAAGAEVNQNAFSTIATGSARYAATAKQSAFLIDGDGGTSVSLDTKTGRLTLFSHTHNNKAVLDQLNEEQWKFINGAANKAHVHENKGTLDKITDVGWNTVYGYTHSHDNKPVLDKTTASYTAADKKKLDGMDLSKYLPKSGGVMTGDIDMQTNKKDILVGTQKASYNNGTPIVGGIIDTDKKFVDMLPTLRSFMGTYHYKTSSTEEWWDFISVRHRNGYSDGSYWGMMISAPIFGGNLQWNLQTNKNTWQGHRTILDSANYTSYAADKNHTHPYITNSAIWMLGSNGTARWYRLGTLVSAGDFSTTVIRVWSGDGANGYASQNSCFEVHIKDGWQSSQSATKACGVTVYRTCCGTVKVKVIPTAHNTYTVWVYLPWGYWSGNYAIYGKCTSWTSQQLIQSSEPDGTAADTAYYDQAFLTSTVAAAKTLTDSGWIATTRNTTFTETSAVKCRKYGQLIEVRGEVTFSDTCGSPTVCTLPAGYRPATVVQACGITPNGKQYMIKADTSGVISFGSDSGSTFVKGTTYRVDLTYLLG